MDEGRVVYYLEIWRDWMKSAENNKLGYPTKSAGFLTGGIHSVEDWEEEGDWEAAKAVHAAIKDLGMEIPQCSKAIHAKWLGDKELKNPLEIDMYYSLALEKLAKKLQSRNLY